MKSADSQSSSTPSPSPIPGAERIFGWLDWSAFWVALVAVLGFYVYTLAPTVTLEDSGELATAGAFLGVPHPPGYPIWTVISWLFSKVFESITYMGQPNPAWSIGLASAVAGALAAAMTAMLLCRSSRDILAGLSKDANYPLSPRFESLACWSAGIAGSFFFAFSPCNWSQSVIVEVYALNAFFLALVMILAYAWLKRPTDGKLVWLSFAFGLGLTNYQGLLILLPALFILVAVKDLQLLRDTLIAGVLMGFVVMLTKIPMVQVVLQDGTLTKQCFLPAIVHPTDATCFVYFALNFVFLAFVYFLLPRGRAVALSILALELGLGFYLFMPLLSEGNPPMNWAYPRTWEGFKHAISRGQYERISPTDVFSGKFVLQVFDYMTDLRKQFTLPVAILGFVPFAAWRFKTKGSTSRIIDVAVVLAIAAGILVTIEKLAPNLDSTLLAGIYKNLIFCLIVAMIVGFVMMSLRQAGESLKDLLTGPASLRVLIFLGASAACLLLLVIAYSHMGPLKNIQDPSAGHETTVPLALSVFFIMLGTILLLVMPLGERLFQWLESPRAAPIDRASVAPVMALVAGIIPLFNYKLLEKFNELSDFVATTPVDAGSPIGTRILLVLPVALPLLIWFGRGIIHSRFGLGTMAVLFLTAAAFIVPTLGAVALESSGRIAPLLPSVTSPGAAQTQLLLLMIAPLFIIILVWLMRSKWELRPTTDLTSIRWLIVTTVAFLVMSILFMILANPKGDLQDAFIQRVKFISSHQLFSFWIAYGMVVGIFSVRRVTFSFMAVPAAVVALLLGAAIPLRENYFNKDLAREIGGAEQNGHDFGWQFGNYQLRGAAAITEELSPDEEPLPDPTFPADMGANAVFFGGTDPGRFVPTYMIYSARVREDVYLITQNALADQTYMNVMRDLYGDRIWIPAQSDSAQAFHRYVDEVQRGIRQPNADLKIEGGRVQVSGALGVMEINGILAQMIFEHNRWRHPFYVEESYVIQWMYPFLTPHGLIMKINHDETALTPDVIRQDSDFWDWYTRRLMSDIKFRRDVVARKSFSKLRTAIAGLYANRQNFAEAESAFQEGRLLYPLSPEANFRLAQEALLPQRRFDYAIEILQEFGKLDPGQGGVAQFTNQLAMFSTDQRRIGELEGKTQIGISIDESMELIRLYQRSGRMQECNMVAMQIASNSNLPPNYLFDLATLFVNLRNHEQALSALNRGTAGLPDNLQPDVYRQISALYMAAGDFQKSALHLNRFLAGNPAPWEPWLELAYLHLQMNNAGEAWKAAQQAIGRNPQGAQDAIMNSPQFEALRPNVMQLQQRLDALSTGSGFKF